MEPTSKMRLQSEKSHGWFAGTLLGGCQCHIQVGLLEPKNEVRPYQNKNTRPFGLLQLQMIKKLDLNAGKIIPFSMDFSLVQLGAERVDFRSRLNSEIIDGMQFNLALWLDE